MAPAVFNSPLETGIRALELLVAAYPNAWDLQKLVVFDHLVVHTGDLGGPESLHPNLPMRSAELFVRRGLVERGVLMLVCRGLIDRIVEEDGFSFRASESAEALVRTLTSEYLLSLKERAEWVNLNYGEYAEPDLRDMVSTIFELWSDQFQISQSSFGGQI